MAPEQEQIVTAFADAMRAAGFDTPEKVTGFVAYAGAVLSRMQASYAVDAARAQAAKMHADAEALIQQAQAALNAADTALTK